MDKSINRFAIKDLKLPLSCGYKDFISKILVNIADIQSLLSQAQILVNIQFDLSNTNETEVLFNNKKRINIWNLSEQICFLITHFPYSTLQILSEILVEYLFKFFPINNRYQSFPLINNIYIQLEIISSNDILLPTTPFTDFVNVKYLSSNSELKQETNSWGHVDIIKEVSELTNNGISAGLYLLHIKPDHSIPLHIHKIMIESEMVISDNLMCQKTIVPYGCTHT
jgi:hypothetical protein